MKNELSVKITITEPMLGLSPGDRKVYERFLTENATPEQIAEESALLPDPADVSELKENVSCVFPKDETGLFWFNYQIRGFFKETLRALFEIGMLEKLGSLSKWTIAKAVDNTLFVTPRRIYLHGPDGKIIKDTDKYLERPLRASTLQGERIALARSQEVPVGTTFSFTVMTLTNDKGLKSWAVLDADKVKACLDYGALKGFGHWRTGGFGQFTWELSGKGGAVK